MGGVAQQLDGLEVAIEPGQGGGGGVDEQGGAAGFEHAPGLAQAGAPVAPMMGGEAAEHGIEMTGRKWQILSAGLDGCDVFKPAGGCLGLHGGEHGGGDVGGGDAGHERGGRVGDMTAAAAQIEHRPAGVGAQGLGDEIEIGAGGVDGAGNIGPGAGAVMGLGVGIGHGGLLCPLIWRGGWGVKGGACL